MNVYRPLPDKPEFSVFEYPGYLEYRVENPQPSYRGFSSLTSLVIPAFLAVSWQFISWKLRYVILLAFLAFIFKQCFLRVQHESLIILPPHGLQLETHRGFSNQWPLFKSTRFIPSASLADVVINEGIKGWNVLYYLAVVKSSTLQRSSLEVAYEDLLPNHDILLQVYEGIHEVLLSRSISHSGTSFTCRNYNHLST